MASSLIPHSSFRIPKSLLPIHLQPFYAERFGYKRGDFPVTESLGDMSLALPFSGVMSEEQVEHVCERLRSHGEGAPRPAQLARA